MAKDNYTQMTNQELVATINAFNKRPDQLVRFLSKSYPMILNEIYHRTEFLNTTKKCTIQTRLYCLKRNINTQPLCSNPNCPNHNPVEWRVQTHNFALYCSRKCSNSDADKKERTKKTMLNTYGVETALLLDSSIERMKHYNQEHYGVDYPFQSKEYVEQIKKQCKEVWGEEFYARTKEFKKLIFDIWNNKTQDERNEINQKRISSCMLSLGVEHPAQSNIVQEKMKSTCKSTLGVENASQSEAIKEKKRNTNNEHWGVDNFSKSPLFSAYHRKRIFHDGKWFDSSWEVVVYDFLNSNGIPFQYSPSISIPYEYDGRTWTYHPDFLVGDRVVEVKGDHFFRINESTGEEEMFTPWRDKGTSDEEYEWQCRKAEAKHQCMLKNNVRILRDADIKNLNMIFNMNNQSAFL